MSVVNRFRVSFPLLLPLSILVLMPDRPLLKSLVLLVPEPKPEPKPKPEPNAIFLIISLVNLDKSLSY
jgi:hypothetical protein